VSVLNDPVLILNKNWQVVGFFPVRWCIETLMRDMGSALHPETYELLGFEEWMDRAPENMRQIKTSGRPVAAPDVVVLKKYGERPPRKVGFNRPNLWKRDQYSCQYCGIALPGSKLQVEHVIPRSRKGPTTWENCVASCDDCNSKKRDRTPAEAGMRLRKKPVKPNWDPKVKIPAGILRPTWKPFLVKEGAV